ncbi:MAG: hypothetical protein HONBIEJF_01882 [Fimbriimonadaceae bacterium]|nr:hypothetical protein [Fimbriimonadaceae bacterium]
MGVGGVTGLDVVGEDLERFTFTQVHMGMEARIVVYAPNQARAEDACEAAYKRIAEIDTIMSDYRQDSELMRFCDKAGGGRRKISPDLFRVFARAQEISKLSGGAFDITSGPIIRLWRQARRTGKLPSASEIAAARRLVGWKHLTLDPKASAAKLALPGMRLDLGAIAKGYACDEAVRILKGQGLTSALVEMGGDLVLGDAPPTTKGWRIRVPNAGREHAPADMVLKNCAVSSSGDTEQFTVIGGVRHSHVVDPRTGMAITNRVQATVVARDGLTSDPLSTALTIVTPSSRNRLLKKYPGAKAYVRVLPGMG